MKAIIYAAGRGQRLKNLIKTPKCLINIAGKPLIIHYLNNLSALGVMDIVIIVGYKHELIRSVVSASNLPIRVKFIENSDYLEGSILSSWVAREEFDNDLLLMESDIYFEPEVLRRLINCPKTNCFAVDASDHRKIYYAAGGVEGRIISIGFELKGDYDMLGEWIGFLKLDRKAAKYYSEMLKQEVFSGRRDSSYYSILPELLKKEFFSYSLIDGLKWANMNTPKDYELALSYFINK